MLHPAIGPMSAALMVMKWTDRWLQIHGINLTEPACWAGHGVFGLIQHATNGDKHIALELVVNGQASAHATVTLAFVVGLYHHRTAPGYYVTYDTQQQTWHVDTKGVPPAIEMSGVKTGPLSDEQVLAFIRQLGARCTDTRTAAVGA